MATHRDNSYDLILGRLLCDRFGLNPHEVRADGISTEDINASTVLVSAATLHFIPREDLLELQALAHTRYMAGQPVG